MKTVDVVAEGGVRDERYEGGYRTYQHPTEGPMVLNAAGTAIARCVSPEWATTIGLMLHEAWEQGQS